MISKVLIHRCGEELCILTFERIETFVVISSLFTCVCVRADMFVKIMDIYCLSCLSVRSYSLKIIYFCFLSRSVTFVSLIPNGQQHSVLKTTPNSQLSWNNAILLYSFLLLLFRDLQNYQRQRDTDQPP